MLCFVLIAIFWLISFIISGLISVYFNWLLSGNWNTREDIWSYPLRRLVTSTKKAQVRSTHAFTLDLADFALTESFFHHIFLMSSLVIPSFSMLGHLYNWPLPSLLNTLSGYHSHERFGQTCSIERIFVLYLLDILLYYLTREVVIREEYQSILSARLTSDFGVTTNAGLRKKNWFTGVCTR